jgi:hypothetical protein
VRGCASVVCVLMDNVCKNDPITQHRFTYLFEGNT